MVNDNNTCTEDNEDKMNYNETESFEITDNQSIRIVDQFNRHKAFKSKTHAVQVSHKIVV